MIGILETTPYKVKGTILHIGAGQCRELNDYLATSASRVVLVEPNPGDVRILKQHARQDERVKVISAAVSGTDGKATLYYYNNQRFNGLHPPEAFNRQLPGLRAVEMPEVETLSIASLLEKLPLEKDKSHCLVIEAKGQEGAILRGLKEANGHPVFKHIVVYAGAYGKTDQAGVTSSSLLANLAEIGYRPEEVALDDEGYFVFSAKVDEQWDNNNRLKKENRELKKELEKSPREEGLVKSKEQREQLSELQLRNQKLQIENELLQQRQKNLEIELEKAGAQVELIKDLLRQGGFDANKLP